MKKIFFFIVMILVNVSTLMNAQTELLQDLINEALRVSPEIKMLNAKIIAVESKVEQNSNLPDPMFSIGIMSLPVSSFAFNEEMMTGKVIGLSQEFPFPGKLSTIRNSREKDVEIVKLELAEKQNEIQKQITQLYYDLINIRKELELTEKSKKLLEDILEVVRSMYSSAQSSQQNIFRLELELSKMNDMIFELKGEENEIVSRINSFLLRDLNTPILTEYINDINFFSFTVDELISKADESRPYLKSLLLSEQREKINQSIAEYDYYPMFKISGQYAFREKLKGVEMPPSDLISIMLDVSLPLNYGGKVTAMVDETKAMQEMYMQQYDASLQMLRSEFGMITSKLNSLKQRIELLQQGSLVQASSNYQSALTAYQVGEIDFMNVIEAQTELLNIEKDLSRFRTKYLKLLSDIEFLTGYKISNKFNNGDRNEK
ncbi:TolC family protein [Ignavibacterium sp.]|uniref:TolC family protein n=1 Tax=Ignavibacterium sp. TaxID=2651167 RepID=UPI00307F2B14